MKRLTGLVAATYSPMDGHGRLALDRVPCMVEYLVEAGLSGLYVCGSTGEGVSMTGVERKALAEAFIKAAAGRVPVIVQVGHNSVVEARELAAHAQAAGADMISATSPSYFKPGSVEILLGCMAEIAAGAPDLPFYYYHIPQLTGMSLDMVAFLEQGEDTIPSLAGIKFSDLKLFDFQACRAAAEGRFDILWGCDEMLLGALASGAEGAVGSTFNVAAPIYRKVIEAFAEGDIEEARRWQLLSVRFVRILNKHAPVHTSLKAVLAMVGLDCGTVRLPQPPITEEAYERIRSDLDAEGIWESLSKAG